MWAFSRSLNCPWDTIQSVEFELANEKGFLITAPNWPFKHWTNSSFAITYRNLSDPSCRTCYRKLQSSPVWYLYEVNLYGQFFTIPTLCDHCKEMHSWSDDAYVYKWLSPIHTIANEKIMRELFPLPWRNFYHELIKYQKQIDQRILIREEISDSRSLTLLQESKPVLNLTLVHIIKRWQEQGILKKQINGKIPLKTIRVALEKERYHTKQHDPDLEKVLMNTLGVNVELLIFGKSGKLRGIKGYSWEEQF